MIVKMVRNAKVTIKAGEMVDVSPAEANFLISVGSAVAATPAKSEPVKETRKRRK